GHALNTPLANIAEIVGVILLDRADSGDTELLEGISDIRDAVGQLSDMLDSLMYLLQAELRYSNRTAVSLQTVIQRVQQRTRTLYGTNIVLHCPDDLPTIDANEAAVEEVINILLTRVFPRLDSGDVLVSAMRGDGRVILTIEKKLILASRETISLK